jgi:3-methyladenine DNA glycosylase/8-oxoguanine DNA glycosylase
VQVRALVAGVFAPVDWPEVKLADWLMREMPGGGVVGYDPWLHTVEEIEKLERALAGSGIVLRPGENLVDRIWTDRPAPPMAAFTAWPEELAGETHGAKRARIGRAIAAEGGAAAALITLPDSIAWLLNIRGADVRCNPVPQAFLILEADGACTLFCRADKAAGVRAHLGEDPELGPLVAQHPGLRAPGAWDGFETAVRAILGQQVTVVAARGLASRLAAIHGAHIDTEPARRFGLDRLFPGPERLADLDPETLPMPRARGRALAAIARLATEDAQLFAPGQDLEGAVRRLSALPGVGAWTAQYIAMRALREPDAFPHSDLALLRAAADPEGRRPTPEALLARAEAWRPWRAYAAAHLWAKDADAASPCKGPAE